MDVHQVIAKKLESNRVQRGFGLRLRVAKDAQQVSCFYGTGTFEKVIKVNEVFEHEILVDDVWPVFVNDFLDDPWAQH